MHPRASGVIVLVLVGVLAGTRVSAQTAPDPPGPHVIDLRGALSGLPQTDFFPPVPSGTGVPTRGFGFDVGGHIYPLALGRARVGLGVNVVRARGTASTLPPAPVPGTRPGPTVAPAIPDIESRFTTVAPQVSFNFGTADGWSYVSAGVGRASIETRSIPPAGTDPATSVEATRSSGGLMAINMGAGARWFLMPHLAFGFDLRFHRLSSGGGAAGGPTPRSTLFAAAAGLSLR